MTCVKLMVAATLGKNLGRPVPKWSNGQWPRAVDSMISCSEVDIFIVVSAYVEP